MLEELKEYPLVVGTKQTGRALAAGKVETVYVAEDADPAMTEPIVKACREAQIEVVPVPTRRMLGSACGVKVGTAVAGRLRK